MVYNSIYVTVALLILWFVIMAVGLFHVRVPDLLLHVVFLKGFIKHSINHVFWIFQELGEGEENNCQGTLTRNLWYDTKRNWETSRSSHLTPVGWSYSPGQTSKRPAYALGKTAKKGEEPGTMFTSTRVSYSPGRRGHAFWWPFWYKLCHMAPLRRHKASRTSE